MGAGPEVQQAVQKTVRVVYESKGLGTWAPVIAVTLGAVFAAVGWFFRHHIRTAHGKVMEKVRREK